MKALFAAMAIPSIRRMKCDFGIAGALPTNYVIDRNGTIHYAKSGAFDLNALNEILVPLLRER